MMKSAEKWRRQNATNGMYCSRRWRVLVDRKVRCEPRYSRSRKIAANGGDAARRTRQRGQDIPAGSNRSPLHNIRSATAIAARLADPECSRPKAADEDVTGDGVAVTIDVSRRYFPTIGLGELVRN